VSVRGRLMAVVAAALAGVGGSCATDPTDGYAFASSYDESIETVSVPIWGNSTFHHGLEVTLTDAIVKRIHATTPWRVTSPEVADASLTGEITAAELVRMSVNRDSGLVQEVAFNIVVSFEWKETRTGRVMLARQGFRASDPFVPSEGARERLDDSYGFAADAMAQSVVAQLREAW